VLELHSTEITAINQNEMFWGGGDRDVHDNENTYGREGGRRRYI
jgi:hypothetical protein